MLSLTSAVCIRLRRCGSSARGVVDKGRGPEGNLHPAVRQSEGAELLGSVAATGAGSFHREDRK